MDNIKVTFRGGFGMGIKRGVLWWSVLLLCLLLTGCSFFTSPCYNKSIDAENYSEIKSVKNIKFEIINNDSVRFNEGIITYFEENPNRSTDFKDYQNQLQILGDLYVDGVFKEAQDGYILLDRDSYIVFVKTFDKSLNISAIKNDRDLIDVVSNNTSNYFGLYPREDDKTSFWKDISSKSGKVIGVVNSKIPLLRDIPLTGYAALIENGNENSALMLVLSDKAFSPEIKKEMRYMVNSLVFDETTKSEAKGSLEFTDKNFSIVANSKNLLFEAVESIIQPDLKNSDDEHKFVTFIEVLKDGKKYEVMSLKTNERVVDEGFVLAAIDNLTLSSMLYEEDLSIDLAFIEKRIAERTNDFLTTLRNSPNTYKNISFKGIVTSETSSYSVITYYLIKDKEVYSCIEIYKEDIVGDGTIISYNVSYKPLNTTSNNSKVAYNEIMTEIGLK